MTASLFDDLRPGSPDGTGGLTEDLARFAVSARYRADDRELAVRPLLDTIGVMIAGTGEPEYRVLADWVAGQAAPGPATVAGAWSRTQPSLAAFANATLANLLDFDDVAPVVKGHPSAVLVPTVLALSAARPVSGAALIDAYLVGLDVMASVAARMDIPGHYALGWHSTSTLGVIAATAAACRLTGAPAGATRSALGMAASFAGGIRQNFGTLTKALHVGRAAEAAIVATTLAGLGGTADPAAIEGPLGFLALFGGGGQTPPSDADVPGHGIRSGLNIKQYPCCYQIHRALDAALALRPRTVGQEITSVEVTVQPNGSASLLHHRPRDGMQAKFSAEYTVAAALLDGSVGLTAFDEASVLRPEAQRLLHRVTLAESACPPAGPASWAGGYAVVQATLADGRALTERADIPYGDARRPLSQPMVRQKFRDCLRYAGLAASADAIARLVEELPSALVAGDLLAAAAAAR
jgi:2-methylcitrate dehydratase PrpD